jgi:hypothetical protein
VKKYDEDFDRVVWFFDEKTYGAYNNELAII